MVLSPGGAAAAAAVPEIVAVPSPLSVKERPLGRVPVLASAAVGEPVVVTVNDFATPVVKVVEAALENCFPMIPSGKAHNEMLLPAEANDEATAAAFAGGKALV